MVPGSDGRPRKTLSLPWETIGDWAATIIDHQSLRPEIVEALKDLLEEPNEGPEGNDNKGVKVDPGTTEITAEKSKKEQVYNCLGNLNWFLDAFLLWASEILDNDGDYFPGDEIIKASPEEVREYVRTVRFNIRILQAIIDASIEYENMEDPLDKHELIDFYNESLKLYRTTDDLIHGYENGQTGSQSPDHSYMDYLSGPGLEAITEFGGEIIMNFHEEIIPHKTEGDMKMELLRTIADGLFKRTD